MNYCSHCGNAVSTGTNFCANCGNDLASSRPVVEQSNQSQTKAPAESQFHYTDNQPHSRIETHTPENGDFEQEGVVEFGDLHPNAVWLFFIYYTGHSSFLLPLIAIGVFFEPWLGLLLVVYLVLHYIAAKITYKNYQFKVTPVAFSKEYGILHKQSATIPLDQIENINISRNLIDRMLGMSHVEIETAGTGGSKSRMVLGGTTSASEGYIPGVAAQEAQDLRDLMLARSAKLKENGN